MGRITLGRVRARVGAGVRAVVHDAAPVVLVGLLASACGSGALTGTAPSSTPSSAASDAAPDGAARVVRVIDGDTVLVAVGAREESVRLIGIDTPETKDPRRPVQCFGQEAAERTAALLPPGTDVRLVRDVVLRDRYDRLLAYVYRAGDDLFVNLTLAREGYAAAATYPPNVAHTDEIVEAARRAREDGRGLWAACDGPDQPVG